MNRFRALVVAAAVILGACHETSVGIGPVDPSYAGGWCLIDPGQDGIGPQHPLPWTHSTCVTAYYREVQGLAVPWMRVCVSDSGSTRATFANTCDTHQ